MRARAARSWKTCFGRSITKSISYSTTEENRHVRPTEIQPIRRALPASAPDVLQSPALHAAAVLRGPGGRRGRLLSGWQNSQGGHHLAAERGDAKQGQELHLHPAGR